MIRLMMKMLWARKLRYGWLLGELLLVSLISWVLLDPLITLWSVTSQPNGFEAQGLYRVVLAEYPKGTAAYDPAAAAYDQRRTNKWRLLELVRSQPQVEQATFFGPCGPFSQSSMPAACQMDTLSTYAWGIHVVPGSDYFQTMRFTEIQQTNAQLDKAFQGQSGNSPQRVILSAEAFPGRSVQNWTDTVHHFRVVGTTAMVRMRGTGLPMPVITFATDATQTQDLVVRLREGSDEAHQLPVFTDWAKRHLRAGNYFVREVQSFRDYMSEDEKVLHQQLRVRSILGGFFLLFLFLGVTGTFWMQTRSRCEEIGIMKSFGATATTIVRSFLWEGVVLVTFAVAVACLLYLQYALKEGLYSPWGMEGNNLPTLQTGRYWFEDFALHFGVISLLTWLVMALVVSLGIYLPARAMSRISATAALADE